MLLKPIIYPTLFLAITLTSCAQLRTHKMHLKTTDDARVAMSLTVDEIPDQQIILTMPEVFTLNGFEGGAGGLGNFNGQDWKITKDGASVQLKDENYEYSLVYKLVEKPGKYSLVWDLIYTNNSDHALENLSAFNCVSMKLAPLFKDDSMTRTWVTDKNGEKKLIKDVAKTQGKGRRTMQFYPSASGIKDLSKLQWINQWDVNSTEVLSGKDVYIISKDNKWKIDTKVDGDVAYFFNNFEITHGCIHAAPLLSASLKPGETAKSSGSINLIKQ